MNNSRADRNLAIVNFTIVSYFIVVGLINLYEVDYVLIGVIGELLTIPFLLAQVVFLMIGVRHLIRNKSSILTATSVGALAICTITTMVSFF